jgi:Zn-finger protein
MININDRSEARAWVHEAENSARFFRNTQCEHFPCHSLNARQFNCLFCFCPMYHMECLSEPRYLEARGARTKDCSQCDYPHRPENYEKIIGYVASSSLAPAGDRFPERASGEKKRRG